MRRAALSSIGLGCGLFLLLLVYKPVLFHGEQFAFRDAAHFYYPLYFRVQQEWQAGRWPLWDPWQNGGQPLLGNPMAAVLYPGKLLFAILPYAWAARLYAVGRTALACAGMVVLARRWGSAVGAGRRAELCLRRRCCSSIAMSSTWWCRLGALGLAAVDRLMRRPTALAGLALVLAMQVLGGDPQAAYLTVLCGALYALLLA